MSLVVNALLFTVIASFVFVVILKVRFFGDDTILERIARKRNARTSHPAPLTPDYNESAAAAEVNAAERDKEDVKLGASGREEVRYAKTRASASADAVGESNDSATQMLVPSSSSDQTVHQPAGDDQDYMVPQSTKTNHKQQEEIEDIYSNYV